MAAKPTPGPAGPGPGVDAQGLPVIDPTANVIAILEAAVRRQDDLRNAEERHVRELLRIREQHANELRIAEKDRIDAIRAVDVAAVQRAADVAAAQASTLAAVVATSAETLRAQVAAASAASDVTLKTALDPIQAAIAELRTTQYQAQGAKAQTTESSGDRAKGNALLVSIIALAAAVVIGVAGIVTAIVAS